MSADTGQEAPVLAYPWFVDWAEDWFFPQYARRLASGNREGTYTWCATWWRHREVAVRMAALWQAWEAARITPDGSAMNGWWLMHADPTMRALTDAANGPMWRCTPQRHEQVSPLPIEPVPLSYFPKPPALDLTGNASGAHTATSTAHGTAAAGGRPNIETITDLDDGLDL